MKNKSGYNLEPLIALIVIVVFLLIIGIKPITIAVAGIALLWLFLSLMTLLFFVMFTILLFSKKKDAVFTRIDKKKNGKFKIAFYEIDGKEYPNVFPEEGFLEKQLYNNNKKYTVFLNKKGFVYDRFAVATCTIGFIFGLLFTAVSVFLIKILLPII